MKNRILNTANRLVGELAYILELSKTIRKKVENNNFSISEIREDLMEIRGKDSNPGQTSYMGNKRFSRYGDTFSVS